MNAGDSGSLFANQALLEELALSLCDQICTAESYQGQSSLKAAGTADQQRL